MRKASIIAYMLFCIGIIYLIVGAIVGYIASRIMHTNSQQGLLLDIVVGVLGAFTTFSTFSFETLELLENGAFARALVNVLANVTLCLAVCWAGLLLGRQVS